jgi:type I restriction-modification system DNA methylase subunit
MKKLQEDIETLAFLDVDKYVRKAGGKCEENVKVKIVIPLLQLLGYSVEKDMDFEHHVANKRADIALLLDYKPKLFVESKDLDEDLDNHIHQALNYAFEQGVEWVILTNGIEIRVYKSFIRNTPHKDRQIFSTTLLSLAQTFDDLFEYVSRDSLLEAKKLTDKAESIRENITAKILIDDLSQCRHRLFSDLLNQFKANYEEDSKFKETINNWATNVKMDISDPALIEKLCKEGAYTLINRVLFLRICEDKGHIKPKLSKDAIRRWKGMFEDPGTLLTAAFSEIGKDFEGLYESPLFDAINFKDITWDKDTISFILDKLGEHDFSIISKDILGKAYEQHISREERKQLGQFYTPDFVIDYILDNTLSQVLINRLLGDIKILDPACGSGGFLMKAYDRLRKQYLEQGWAEEAIHREILQRNLFGIDINPFATQLTVMNLLLKDLEHPTNVKGVVEGDSLDKIYDGLDMDILHTEAPISRIRKRTEKVSLVEMLRNRPFDIVVGNPPYIGRRTYFSTEEKRRLKAQYACATGRYETYRFFIERGIDFVKEGGFLGLIVPHTWLELEQAKVLRKLVLNTCKVVSITRVPIRVFDAVVDNVILVLQRECDEKVRDANVIRIATLDEHSQSLVREITQRNWKDNRDQVFDIYCEQEPPELIERIEENCVRMGEICEVKDGIVAGRIKDVVFSPRKLDNTYYKVLFGKDIDRYEISWGGAFTCRDEARLPKIERERAGNRRMGLWLRDDQIFARPKILTRKTGNKLIACYDEDGYFYEQTLHGTSVKSTQYEIKYVLALLNSRLFDWYYRNHPFQKKRTFPQVRISMLKNLPIKKASLQEQKQIADLVDKIISQKKRLDGSAVVDQREAIQKEIDATDAEIDEKILDLYGITDPKDRERVKEAT